MEAIQGIETLEPGRRHLQLVRQYGVVNASDGRQLRAATEIVARSSGSGALLDTRGVPPNLGVAPARRTSRSVSSSFRLVPAAGRQEIPLA